VGAPTEPVEVTVRRAAELQTFGATVGNVVQGEEMVRLPNISRGAMQRLLAPTFPSPQEEAIKSDSFATVAGLRRDQTT
jgi:hypothetical protein